MTIAMVLRQPWALLGLLALVLPVLVHLLSRAPARRGGCASLRFVDESRLPPRRLTSVHEPWLMALRMAIVLLAALALAQPVFGARAVPRLARAIVVDTSASMMAPLPGVPTLAADSARRLAGALAEGASVSRVLLTASPASAMAAAAGWLGAQRASRELVVLSDFRGFDSTGLARVPASYGVRLVPVVGAIADTFRVPSAPPFASTAVRVLDDRTVVRADSVAARVRTVVRLDVSALPAASGANVRRAVEALRGAAHAEALFDGAASRYRVRIVVDAAEASRATAPSRTPPVWATDLLVGVAADPLARETASETREATVGSHDGDIPVLHDATGAPVVVARWNATDSSSVDLALARTDAAEALAAALALAMAGRNESLDEHETARATDETLRRLSRAPADTVSGLDGVRPGDRATHGGPSDSRPVWALVVMLLGAETLLRRRFARREPAS